MHMKYEKTNSIPSLLIGFLSMALCHHVGWSTTTISSGHTDIFEAEYEQDGTNTPTVHLGVHTDTGHYEPADVLLEVGNAAYGSTAEFSPTIISLLGANAWILPADLEAADQLGIIQAGVVKAGFPDTQPVTFTMVAAGAANPGNFALFNSGSAIRLSATGSEVGTSSFSITTGHIHYNWGFSAPGTYTFDMKASYTDAAFGVLESAVETYTFNVIPEPTGGALLLTAFSVGLSLRRRFLRS
jgi:surface-anchored protein